MNREESLTIVGMILDCWQGGDWTKEQMDAYARAIEDLDAEMTVHAIAAAVKESRFRPSVAELREYVKLEKVKRAVQPEEWRDLPPERPPKPKWVERWERARNHRDYRWFPEQVAAGMEKTGYPVPKEPFSDRNVWVGPDEYND